MLWHGELLDERIFARPIRPVVIFKWEPKDYPSCFMYAYSAKRHKRKGCQAYLAYVMDTQKEGKKLNEVPIMNEFPNLLPKDLTSLPPPRELEFTIDLVLKQL